MTTENVLFVPVLYVDAGPELKEIYDDIMAEFQLSFVPNYFKSQGSHVELLKGNWEKIKSVLFRGTVSRIFKEEVVYRISKARHCSYCAFVHGRIVEELRHKIEQLKGGESNARFTEKEELAMELLKEMALQPPPTKTTNIKRLLFLDFSKEQIPELTALVDLTVMLNTHADVSGIAIDEELLSSS